MGRQRPFAAGRPQPHIDIIEPSAPRRDGQGRDQTLGQPCIILHRMKRPRTLRLRPRGIEIVNQNEIEIGGRRHLARTKLAERQNRQPAPRHFSILAGKVAFDMGKGGFDNARC